MTQTDGMVECKVSLVIAPRRRHISLGADKADVIVSSKPRTRQSDCKMFRAMRQFNILLMYLYINYINFLFIDFIPLENVCFLF